MSKIVIGIHGLNNKPKKEHLNEGWMSAMREGLTVNCATPNPSFAYEGVYWADVMNETPDPNPDSYSPAKASAIKRYNEGMLDDIRQKALKVGGGFLDWLKERADTNRLATKVLEEKLPDLYRYYSEVETESKIKSCLKECLVRHKNKRIFLIGHSMGSIIAYDVLRELGNQDEHPLVEHFVTIGSPLGMPHVKHQNDNKHGNLRTPTIVRRWTNLADKRDPVAADEHLGDDYSKNVNGVKVKDDLVYNDWVANSKIQIHHKSYGYLRTPEFSDLLSEFV